MIKFPNQEKNYLLVLVEFLFVMLLVFSLGIVLKKIIENKEDISAVKLPGRYLIVFRWPQHENPHLQDDIDAHLMSPSGDHAWFKDKLGGQAYLEMTSEDDTGHPIRFYTDIKTGELKMCDWHEEKISINVTVEGEYKLVAYCYLKRFNNIPIKVTATLIDLKNSSQELIKEEVELLGTGEQKTVFRFSLDSAGNVVPGSVNQREYKIEETSRYR